jgi:hypothetical protein
MTIWATALADLNQVHGGIPWVGVKFMMANGRRLNRTVPPPNPDPALFHSQYAIIRVERPPGLG